MPGKPAVAVTPPPGGSAGARREITLKREEEKPARSPEVVPLSGESARLLPLRSPARSLPEDFEIGALQDQLDADGETLEACRMASRFLTALAAGRIDSQLIFPEKRVELGRFLAAYLEEGPPFKSFRLGRVSGTEARLNVRLFSEQGACAGEIYLLKQENRWWLQDLQVSFEQLKQAYKPKHERYLPSRYGWLEQGGF